MQLDDLENVSPDAKRYPAFNAELRASMMEETARFFEDLSARASGNLLDFVTADATFVDAVLARLYGVPAPAAGWARQTMPAGQRGAGVLTQASLLTLTTPHDGVEPIKRGQFVRTALLCQRLPPPPPNVPPLEAAQVPATATPRERLSAHRENPACGGCHQLLDPIGFGLARFDGVGAYRDKDAHGNPIDARGSIAGFTTPDFDGPRELGDRLRGAPEVSRCVATQLFRHATARTESDDDRCLIDRIDDSFRRGGQGWGALVEATVRSDAFRMRRIPETAGGAP